MTPMDLKIYIKIRTGGVVFEDEETIEFDCLVNPPTDDIVK